MTDHQATKCNSALFIGLRFDLTIMFQLSLHRHVLCYIFVHWFIPMVYITISLSDLLSGIQW